ncbi:MAG: hypothetical protein HDS16_04775 [Bacteroides sp.]|nr:hypothetical protein [Bacteroides sp.]
MKKWQKENPNERAVLCVATDKGASNNTLFGMSLPLMGALLSVMIEDSSWVDVCKGALTAKENPIAALALISALEKFEKESELSSREDEDKPSNSSIKDSLKTILTKLADKL